MAQDRQFSWRRSVAWAVSIAVHLAVVVAMTLPSQPAAPAVIVDTAPYAAWVTVDVPELPSVERPPTPEVLPREVAPLASRERPVRAPAEPPVEATDRNTSPPRSESATTVPSALGAPVARPVAYLDDESRALLPQENLYSAKPPPREGDYYTPGNGSEDDVFYRPRALDPNPSRFAHAWQPRGSLIDDWLGQLVEKTTGQVSVPLNAKFSLVCKASVAGLGGGCAIVRNGGTGVIVQRPPPAPWERSNRVQCRELRQALEDAEEAVQVAYFLDRLTALCGPGTETGIDAPDDEAGNDEARREAGLPEDRIAPEEARSDDQRGL